VGHRVIAGLAAVGVASAIWSGSATADPKGGDTFTLNCDNGRTYTVATPKGQGEFTPAFNTEGTGVLVPVSFGNFSGVVRNAQGQIVETFSEPGTQSKGQSTKGLKNPVTCTFTFTEVSDGSDPEFPAGYTFTGSGTVVVRITPSR
jgi:hypothetical protein